MLSNSSGTGGVELLIAMVESLVVSCSWTILKSNGIWLPNGSWSRGTLYKDYVGLAIGSKI